MPVGRVVYCDDNGRAETAGRIITASCCHCIPAVLLLIFTLLRLLLLLLQRLLRQPTLLADRVSREGKKQAATSNPSLCPRLSFLSFRLLSFEPADLGGLVQW